MDREKRRSKEDEEELDRKIALIREKNLKIEQRSKEVEADRVQNADSTPRKPSQAPRTQPAKTTGKNKAWDREWDQGKTPVETWRENVPSIEHTGRLASAQNQKQRNRQQKPSDVINRGGRLEGRLSVVTEKPAKGKGSGGQRDNRRAVHQNKTGDLTVNVKVNSEEQPSGRGERQGRRNRGNSEKKTQESAKEGAKKDNNANEENREVEKKNKTRRPRRENDKYIVKVTLMRVLDKVDKMERKRKREEHREKEEQEKKENKANEAEQAKDENKAEVNEEVKEALKLQEEPEKKPETEKAKEEEKSEENAPDANQNVITLTKERVLSVQMTS